MAQTDEPIDALIGRGQPPDTAALSSTPRIPVAVVTCMDARILPQELLGLSAGDVNVLRNAGGVITEDVRRSLALSQQLLGTTDIMVIRHTECGLLGLDDDAFVAEMHAQTGVRPPWRPHGFTDVEQGVREAIVALAADPHLTRTRTIRGFVYDVGSGELSEVGASGPGSTTAASSGDSRVGRGNPAAA